MEKLLLFALCFFLSLANTMHFMQVNLHDNLRFVLKESEIIKFKKIN